VRVFDPNYSASVVDTSAATFTLMGAITAITSPTSTSVWYKGQNDKAIAWVANGPVTNVKIEYKTSLAGAYTTIAADDSGHTHGGNSYTWSAGIPDENSESCYIRVSDLTLQRRVRGVRRVRDPSVITVSAPTVGSILRVDGTYADAILWSLNGSTKVSNVSLLYSTNGTNGPFDKTIATPVEASLAKYTWTNVDNTISNNVVVKVVDTVNANAFGLSPVFKIAGSITVDVPNGGNNWKVGEGQTISWSKAGSIGNAKIYVDYGSGYEATALATVETGAVSSWTWNPFPDQVTNNARIKIAAASDEANVYDESNAVFKIAANFAITAPANGAVMTVGGSYNITWTCSGSAVTLVKLEYSTNGGTDWTAIGSDISNTGTYSWTVPTRSLPAARSVFQIPTTRSRRSFPEVCSRSRAPSPLPARIRVRNRGMSVRLIRLPGQRPVPSRR
jgi:hypothetical protein